MRCCHEQNQPHVGDGSFGVKKRLKRKREDNCCKPTNPFAADSGSPGEYRRRNEGSRHRRGKSRREIVFAEHSVARDLGPVGEGRFIKAKLIIEIRYGVVAALDHFPRRLREARFVAIHQRNAPRADDVENGAPKE